MYQAIIAKIHTRPFPNADRLQLGTCCGYQVIVGKEILDGEEGIFFEQGGQLSDVFCQANDLIRRRDEQGNMAGGMFEPNRRVKAIRLRGEKSEGYWTPLTALNGLGISKSTIEGLEEGTQFSDLDGVEICRRYETPATKRVGAQQQAASRVELRNFPKHFETGHLRREAHTIQAGAHLYVTEKLHGTSFRYGHVYVPKKFSSFEKFLRKVRAPWVLRKVGLGRLVEEKFEWRHMNGTRNCIVGDANPSLGEKGKSFRIRAVEGITLHRGEVLYGEIVGYEGPDCPIMQRQGTGDLKDKRVLKRFGDRVTYAYRCADGQFDIYIYRIAYVNPEGVQVDLSWPKVVRRCNELGLKPVPMLNAHGDVFDGDQVKFVEAMTGIIDQGGLVASTLDPSHPMEGVVVRAENPDGSTVTLKHKSFLFGILEGFQKESDDFIDTEEAS